VVVVVGRLCHGVAGILAGRGHDVVCWHTMLTSDL
jgi:hypothetical protein